MQSCAVRTMLSAMDELWMMSSTSDDLWMMLSATDDLWMMSSAMNDLWMMSSATDNLWMMSSTADDMCHPHSSLVRFHILTSSVHCPRRDLVRVQSPLSFQLNSRDGSAKKSVANPGSPKRCGWEGGWGGLTPKEGVANLLFRPSFPKFA